MLRRVGEDLVHALTSPERAELVRLLAVVVRPLGAEAPAAWALAEPALMVARIQTRLHAEVTAALRPLHLAPRHAYALAALANTDGPVSQARLARLLGVQPPTVLEVVDYLQRRSLAVRTRDSTDRRRQLLSLTSRAASLEPLAAQSATLATDKTFAPLERDDQRRLHALMLSTIIRPLEP